MFELKSYEDGYKWNIVSICFAVASIIMSITTIVCSIATVKEAKKDLEEE